jgi:hypothetical protein
MHSKFIVSDGVAAAVLATNVLADTHPGGVTLALHIGPCISGGQFCIQNIIHTKEIRTKE